MKPRFFRSAATFRNWLTKNHDKAQELPLGFYKVGPGKRGITYAEALDQALCFGWIDAVRRGIDETSYSIRFARRKPNSIWSQVNIGHVARLTQAGFMQPSGLAAFKRLDPARAGIYSYEARPQELSTAYERAFRASPRAWAFFSAQAPWYRRTASYWVMSAKKEETRQKRLAILIEDSANIRRLRQLTPPAHRAAPR